MRDWSPFIGLPLWVWLFVLPTGFAFLCVVCGARLRPVLRPLWAVLDRIYLGSGVIAACFMVTILALIVAQMVARWAGISFPGSTHFAGYAMACTSFFALAYAMTRGAHIRVSIFLNMSQRVGRWLDVFALLISAITATYFARYAIKTNVLSEMLNDRTQDQDKIPEWLITFLSMFGTVQSDWGDLWALRGGSCVSTPIWVQKIAMSMGTGLLAICMWDMLYRTLIEGQNPIRAEAVE